MKITICDICKYVDNKITDGSQGTMYRRGFTGHSKIDVCSKHRTYDMGNTPQEFAQKEMDMMFPQHVGDK